MLSGTELTPTYTAPGLGPLHPKLGKQFADDVLYRIRCAAARGVGLLRVLPPAARAVALAVPGRADALEARPRRRRAVLLILGHLTADRVHPYWRYLQ